MSDAVVYVSSHVEFEEPCVRAWAIIMFHLLRRFVDPVPDETRRFDLHEPEHRVARDVCGIARYLTHWGTKVGQIQKIMGDVKPSSLQ